MAASRLLYSRILTTTPKPSALFTRAFTYATTTRTTNCSALPRFSLLRQLSAVNLSLAPSSFSRTFSTRRAQNSISDGSPNWSNRPPQETILLDGCDFEHWLVVVDTPPQDWTRDQIIDHYIKTLAKIVGSEEEARMKIYSVSTRCYYAFGAHIPEDLSHKLKDMEGIRWVLPDSYLDVKNKNYGGEPFIDGEAAPYDPKYHEDWVRNNQKAMERNRRNDRPRNADRSRNFERRSRPQGFQDNPNPGGNMGGMQNQGGTPNHPGQNMQPPNAGYPQNMPPPHAGYPQNMPSPPNAGYTQNISPPNNAGYPQNMAPPNNAGYPQNMAPPNNAGYPQNMAPPNNAGYPQNMPPPNNAGYAQNFPPANNAGFAQNRPPANNSGYGQNMPPNNGGYAPHMPQNNPGSPQNMPPNMDGPPPSYGGQGNPGYPNTMPNHQGGGGSMPYQSSQMGGQPNYTSPSNMGGGQSQNVPGRD